MVHYGFDFDNQRLNFRQVVQTGYNIQKVTTYNNQHILIVADQRLVHMRLTESGGVSQLKECANFKHTSAITSAALHDNYYLVTDKTKMTIYNRQKVNVFVY